ncbi:MAG TPA: PfkB family carbohydrate kinase [Solirubrobacteraceae bacterium]|nr:PfkB family carbohydrate kinase [Solirubrobacteraceae bacterium]
MTGGGPILVAGEALYDLVLDDTDALRAHPGGGPFNTARTLGRLDRPVAYLGRLSTDRFGTRLERLLAEDGVRLDAVVHTDDPTTLALAEVDAGGSARYRFYERGTAAPGLTEADALAAVPDDGVAILHVGTLGLALEPVATALEALVGRLASSALVAVDPNCRPWVLRDPAPYRARLDRVMRAGDLVKVSDEDLAWLDPDRPPLQAARGLLDLGPAVVLLTRGGDGAVAVTRAGDVAVPAPPTRVVDTIGAGDAFGGGFLAWWHARGLGAAALADTGAVEEATRFAALVAAKTCERAGASPPHAAELPGL